MRTRLPAAVLALAALPLLGGCSTAGGSKNAAATTTAPAKSAAPSAGSVPVTAQTEAASALPKECSQILTTAQLQAVFGAGFPIGVNYGTYAALPSIGRTGRVACIFGVGLDSFGKQSAGALEVSISTYSSAAVAVGRAADTVQSDSQAGATEASVTVGGQPATVVVEQTAVGASTAAASGSAAASPSPTASASTGETELVMANGNRTFVLQIPFTKLAAQQALTALTQLTLEVYQNTIPTAAAPGPSKS
ncbi:MAG TPA: hypothetical protein VFN97_20170 [Actinospica sp.]|nr:hypothetical protein [Actinospica sp.]